MELRITQERSPRARRLLKYNGRGKTAIPILGERMSRRHAGARAAGIEQNWLNKNEQDGGVTIRCLLGMLRNSLNRRSLRVLSWAHWDISQLALVMLAVKYFGQNDGSSIPTPLCQREGQGDAPMVLNRKMLNLSLILSLMFLFPLAAHTQSVRIGGTGSALGVMQMAAEVFKKTHPEAKFTFVPGLGSGGGRRALLGGAIDIALTAKARSDAEKVRGAVVVLLGRSPLVFATAKSNPAAKLTTDELVAIWAGKTTTWPDGSRLRLILRPERDSDTDVLKSISPAMERAVKQALSREGMKIAVTDDESAEAIQSTPGAMGTAVLALLLAERRSLKPLSINGVAPTTQANANGSYPYYKSFYAVTTSKAAPGSEEFVAFLTSAAGQQVLSQLGIWMPQAGQ